MLIHAERVAPIENAPTQNVAAIAPSPSQSMAVTKKYLTDVGT